MKRACSELLKVGALTAPPVSFFLQQGYLKLEIFAANSLLEVFTWRIPAGLVPAPLTLGSLPNELYFMVLYRCR